VYSLAGFGHHRRTFVVQPVDQWSIANIRLLEAEAVLIKRAQQASRRRMNPAANSYVVDIKAHGSWRRRYRLEPVE